MAFSQQQQSKPFSIFKILCEAFQLPAKSFTLILPILIIYFLSSELLLYIIFHSLPDDLPSKLTSIASVDPKNPEYAQLTNNILKYFKDSSPVISIFFIASFVLSSLLHIATIHGFTLIGNSTKHPTHSDLLYKLGRGIKGPMITSLYVALLKLGYILLVLAIFLISIVQGSLVLLAFGSITILISPFLYLHLSMVWSVSVVASVVEDGCYGLEAISKARKIIKGRRMQGALLTLIGFAIIGVVTAVQVFTKGYVNPTSTMEKMGIGFIYGVLLLVMDLFTWAVSMVFYCDCKRINGEEGNKDNAGGFMYVSLPTKAYDEV